MKSHRPNSFSRATRRTFLKSVGRSVAAASLASLDISRFAHGAGASSIRLGLIGCGGRGTGGTRQALATGKDVKLVAMADLFEEKINSGLAALRIAGVPAEQVQVNAEQKFVGFNAFQNLLASGVDAVILATPPGFRPLHFEAAANAGVHAFLEKPVAIDAPGVRQVRAATTIAHQKGLSVIVGFQERFHRLHEEFIRKISNG